MQYIYMQFLILMINSLIDNNGLLIVALLRGTVLLIQLLSEVRIVPMTENIKLITMINPIQ